MKMNQKALDDLYTLFHTTRNGVNKTFASFVQQQMRYHGYLFEGGVPKEIRETNNAEVAYNWFQGKLEDDFKMKFTFYGLFGKPPYHTVEFNTFKEAFDWAYKWELDAGYGKTPHLYRVTGNFNVLHWRDIWEVLTDGLESVQNKHIAYIQNAEDQLNLMHLRYSELVKMECESCTF